MEMLILTMRGDEPRIEINHDSKSDDLRQKVLDLFLKQAFERGLQIRKVGGSIGPGVYNDRYEIAVKPF